MEHLKKDGIVIYIDVEFEEIERRLDNISTRGITLGIDRLAPGTYYLLLKTERITSKHTFIKK